MTRDYYTVEQISELLSIHPKTIQRYIREGRLRATKIGKGWRVTGHDLSVFAEREGVESGDTGAPTTRSVIASAVVDIPVDRTEDAVRIMNTLTAALNSKPPEYGQSAMQSQYIERECMVRATLWGDVRFMAVMMDTVAMLAEQNGKE